MGVGWQSNGQRQMGRAQKLPGHGRGSNTRTGVPTEVQGSTELSSDASELSVTHEALVVEPLSKFPFFPETISGLEPGGGARQGTHDRPFDHRMPP